MGSTVRVSKARKDGSLWGEGVHAINPSALPLSGLTEVGTADEPSRKAADQGVTPWHT